MALSAELFAQADCGVVDINAYEFLDKIQDENNHLLLDVRPSDEFKKNRIPGAINVPNSGVMNQILDTMDLDRPVLLYCKYGDRSHMAACKALEKYQGHFFNLEGGLQTWKRNNFEISRKHIKAAKLR